MADLGERDGRPIINVDEQDGYQLLEDEDGGVWIERDTALICKADNLEDAHQRLRELQLAAAERLRVRRETIPPQCDRRIRDDIRDRYRSDRYRSDRYRSDRYPAEHQRACEPSFTDILAALDDRITNDFREFLAPHAYRHPELRELLAYYTVRQTDLDQEFFAKAWRTLRRLADAERP